MVERVEKDVMQRHEAEKMSEKERGDKKVMCVELKEYR